MALTAETPDRARALPPPRPVARGVRTMLALLVAAAVTVSIQLPAIESEPVFVTINVAVVVSMVALGCYLFDAHERFSGLCFVTAGAGWIVTNLDVYPEWGSGVSWLIGGALVYTSIGWGVLRYGRSELGHRERLFVSCCLAATVGMSILLMLVSRPEWLSYSPDAVWLTVWPSETATFALIVVACIGYLALGVLFASVAFRRLAETPPIQRRIQRPLVLAGAGWAGAAAIVTTVGSLSPETVSIHTNSNIVGVLSVAVTVALAVAINRTRLVGASFLDALPTQRTPEALVAYVRAALSDPTAELLFVVPERDLLIDGRGRQRQLPGPGSGFHRWVVDSAGQRVAVLTGDALLGNDPGTLRSFSKVVSILAENEQLHAVLRMRLVQLTATRTAEKLAFDRAREQFRRDLHDGVQQTVAAARIDLDGLRDALAEPHGPAQADELERKLAVALDQIRCLKQGVDPPELTFGLRSAVERVIAELRLEARCRIDPVDLGVLTLPVYYAAREALTNAHKYARHSSIEVTLVRLDDVIELTVRDTGPGGAAIRRGGGIAGLQERAAELGGSLSLHSRPGVGTTLTVLIPPVPT